MNCLYCQQSTTRYNIGNDKRYTYICENEICHKDTTLHDYKWMIGFDHTDKEIIFYSVWVSHNNNNYFIDARAELWTRLYYDLPNFGALMQAPILEIPCMLPLKEPYLDSIKQHLDKFLILLPFI